MASFVTEGDDGLNADVPDRLIARSTGVARLQLRLKALRTQELIDAEYGATSL
jgi:hypothetical protein